MKEIWELAISPQVLPLTILLVPVALYWALNLMGVLDLEFLDADFDWDAPDHEAHGATSWLQGALRIMNAREVPSMVVLSILALFLWAGSMIGNLWFNPSQSGFIGGIIAIAALIAAVVFTRLAVAPLKPFFRLIRADDETHPPVVGRTGIVRTAVVDEYSGQVEVEAAGAPLLLNARVAAGSAPLSRNAEVIVIANDADSGTYVVRSISETNPSHIP